MKSIITILLFVASHSLLAQETSINSTKIEIISADQLVYNQEMGRYQMCIGHVKFRQGNMYLDCDSARFYENINKIEAFGNIYIRQQDTLDLWGGYLEYNGDTRLAKVSKNVKLSDGEMVLKTDLLNYNMETKTGYYTTGGDITNEKDELYSTRGTYFSRSKEFNFKDSVRLYNPEYTMESDTLKYNTVRKVATFVGPTYIKSDENTIYCQYGWYDTDKNVSQFSRGAYIQGKDNKLKADSIIYFRNTGYGEAFRNLELTDTLEGVNIIGEYGNYNRFSKTTLITGNPIAIKNVDGDSFFLKADTFIDIVDTSLASNRILHAFRNVKVFKTDIQAISDSLVYNFSDSVISFYSNPILWAESNQITGDTISVYQGKGGLEKIESYNHGFVIEKDSNGFFNQIKGKKIYAFFTLGKINRVNVVGNGQSVYYVMEDSAKYAGINDVICGSMVINFDAENKIKTIVFKQKPKATFYPLEKFPSSKAKLPDFEWFKESRPRKVEFSN